jgi:hypothetical protein
MDGASAPEQQRRLRTHRASGRASNNQANIYQIQKERKKSSRGGYAPTDVRKPLAAWSIPNAKGEKGRKKKGAYPIAGHGGAGLLAIRSCTAPCALRVPGSIPISMHRQGASGPYSVVDYHNKKDEHNEMSAAMKDPECPFSSPGTVCGESKWERNEQPPTKFYIHHGPAQEESSHHNDPRLVGDYPEMGLIAALAPKHRTPGTFWRAKCDLGSALGARCADEAAKLWFQDDAQFHMQRTKRVGIR